MSHLQAGYVTVALCVIAAVVLVRFVLGILGLPRR